MKNFLTILVLVMASAFGQPDAHANPQNTTYVIDGMAITLVKGLHETAPLPGTASTETTAVQMAKPGDLDGDGDPDYAVVLRRSTGGSGTFYYVAAALNEGEGVFRGTNAVFIGDRIEIQKLRAERHIISVRYLDREPDAAMAETPTVTKNAISLLFGAIVQPLQQIDDANPVVLGNLEPDSTIHAPLHVRGAAPGNWFFEGDFPMELLADDGSVIAEGFCTAVGRWRTNHHVTFKGTLTFEIPSGATKATLRFMRDNPSDDRSLDEDIRVPVQFAPPKS